MKIDIRDGLVVMYYNSIIEKNWSPSTIKNKLAYFKRKGQYEDQLALQCANSKFKLEMFVDKLEDRTSVSKANG